MSLAVTRSHSQLTILSADYSRQQTLLGKGHQEIWVKKLRTAAPDRGHRGTHLLLRRILAAGTAARVLLAGALLAGFSAASTFAAGGPASLALTTTAASADTGCSASISESCSVEGCQCQANYQAKAG